MALTRMDLRILSPVITTLTLLLLVWLIVKMA
jgi:hypothetical protein